MRIVTAHIFGYGKFINKTFNFNQGMNAVIGYNETGKSTLMSFVKAMLYGHKKNEREGKDGSLPEVKKYKPWNTDKYGGYLIVHTDDGRLLRIERDFNSKSLTVYNENNEDITSEFSFSKDNGMLGQDLLGMDLECFMNSAFVCQDKSILYPEDKENIAQKLMNISESAEEDVSVADSIKILKDGKTFLGNERTSKRRYNNLISNIRTEKEELLKMQTENENCIEYLEEANVLKDEIKQLELEEKLCVKKQVYEEVIKDIEKYEKNKYEADSLKEGLSVIDIEEYEKSKELLDEEIKAVNFNEEDKDNLYKNIKINNSIITLLIIIGVLILTAGIILSIIVDMWFLLLALITAGCGIGLFLLLKKNKENQNIIEKIDEIIHKEDSLQKTKTKIEENKSKEDLIKRYERLMIDILINQDVADFDALKEKAEVFSPKKTYPQISHDECVRQIQRKRERLAVVNAQIDKYLKSDDQIASQQEKIEVLEEQRNDLIRKQKAIDYAILGIEEASRQIKEEIIPKMNEKMSSYLYRITAKKHDNLLTGSQMDLNTEYSDRIRSANNFSEGTLRQMYLAFRLAASNVFSNKKVAPVFMDEALVYYDKERKKSTFDFLYEMSTKTQIIYFATDIEDALIKNKEINIINLTD